MNFISRDGRCMSHGLDRKLVLAQSEAIGIPVIRKGVTWETYERDFKSAMRELKQASEGAILDICDIAKHEGRIGRVRSELGIEPKKPLWGSEPEGLLSGFIWDGFEALVAVKADSLGREWLGRRVDDSFIRDLKLDGKVGIHLYMELGRCHTFLHDDPIFKKRIEMFDFREDWKEATGS